MGGADELRAIIEGTRPKGTPVQEELISKIGGGVIGGVTPDVRSGSAGDPAGSKDAFARQQEANRKAATAARIAAANARQQAINLFQKQQRAKAESQAQREIVISRGGGVRTGGSRFIGKAVVPGTGGLTATQLTRQIRQRAIKRGQVTRRDIRRTTFTIPTRQEEIKKRKRLAEKVKGVSDRATTIQDLNLTTIPTDRGTRTDIAPPSLTTPIRDPGDIFKVQTGSIKDTPVFQTQVINPDFTSRPATKEERESLDAIIGARSFERVATRDEKEGLSFLEGKQFDISRQLSETSFKTAQKQGGFTGKQAVTTFGLGVASVGVGTLSSIRHPIKTGKSLLNLGKVITQDPSQIKVIGSRIGETIRTQPFFSVGVGAGIFVTGKLPKLVTKGTDIGRTLGLKKLSTTNIIAPEIAKGQTFPKITKGQTAKQLLAEFKPLFPDEIKQAGFTASPKPLISAKFFGEIKTLRGSSEVPGLFQAPKVSPHFLKVSSEGEKLFSFNIVDTLRPTISRVTPTKFSLVPGIKTKFPSGGFKKGKPITPEAKRIKQFFETAPKGESFLPFIKTEKEAIIPFGTQLVPTGKRFFIKFEGRRIPIKEFKTVTGKVDDINLPKLTTTEALSKSISSSRKIGQKGLITPSEISSVTGSSRGRGSSSSRVSTPSISSIVSTPRSSPKSSLSLSSTLSSFTTSSRTGRRSVSKSVRPSKIQSVSSVLSSLIKTPKSIPRTPVSSRPRIPSKIKQIVPQFKPFGARISLADLPKFKQQRIKVFGRRFGKFRLIGTARTPRLAILKGKRFAETTLGVTFKISGKVQPLKLPNFRTKITKEGTLFIERRGRRLKKRGSEVLEIQKFKGLKRGLRI